MSIEAGVVLDKQGNPIHWHLPANRSAGYLPDSRQLWDVLWENRHNLSGFAHSHPGSGIPGPSHEDLTTFAAVEAALGLRLAWWILSAEEEVICHHAGPGKLDFACRHVVEPSSGWMRKLRQLSGFLDLDCDRCGTRHGVGPWTPTGEFLCAYCKAARVVGRP